MGGASSHDRGPAEEMRKSDWQILVAQKKFHLQEELNEGIENSKA